MKKDYESSVIIAKTALYQMILNQITHSIPLHSFTVSNFESISTMASLPSGAS